MHHADGILRKDFTNGMVTVLEILQIHLLALLDKGINNIDLPPRFYLATHKLIERSTLRIVTVLGSNGLAAWRQLVDDGDVKVAIERHCEGTGNGRGCHHQHVGEEIVLAPEFGTLGYAEAVLLIDNDKAEGSETHRILQHGVRSNEEIDATVLKATKDRSPALALDAACEQFHTDGKPFE